MVEVNKAEVVAKFEKKHGKEALLKVSISTLNRLLVKKGIVNVNELNDTFAQEMAEWDRKQVVVDNYLKEQNKKAKVKKD